MARKSRQEWRHSNPEDLKQPSPGSRAIVGARGTRDLTRLGEDSFFLHPCNRPERESRLPFSNKNPRGSDDKEEPDWDELTTLDRIERQRVPRNLLPEDDDPLPNGDDQWATLRPRRLRIRTAVSPAARAEFEEQIEEQRRKTKRAVNESCSRCASGQQATSSHLL